LDPHSFGFWVAVTIASVLVGMSKGGLPIVGVLAVPVLALVMNPVAAAGLLLPVYVVSDWFGLYAYRKNYDPRVLKIMITAGIIGIGIGWATASYVPERLVVGIIGTVGLLFAVNLLLRKPAEGPPRRAAVAPGMFWGIIAGFTSFVSHSGGPPYQIYTLPLRMDKLVFAGTSTIVFAVLNAVKLVPYYALGQINLQSLEVAAVASVPAVVAVFAGIRLVRVLPGRTFFLLVTWALLLVSLKLLYDAAAG
jgi:uncharacterized membrane protein YfcA